MKDDGLVELDDGHAELDEIQKPKWVLQTKAALLLTTSLVAFRKMKRFDVFYITGAIVQYYP